MRRTFFALATLAISFLAAGASARPVHPVPTSAIAGSGEMLLPVQAVQGLANRSGTTAAPFKPIGNPTAWVSAKHVEQMSLLPGGSGSDVVSCANRGSAGGTFNNFEFPGNRPQWFDDGFLGAGRPYLWFPGQSQVRSLVGSLPSTAYITPSHSTVYIVMYAHALQSDNTGPSISSNGTAIEFDNIAVAVRSNGGNGRAIGLHRPTAPAPYDFVEAPMTSGDATLHVYKVERHGGVLSISVDGGAPVSVGTGANYTPNEIPRVGFNGQSFNTGMFYGAICEWIVYNRELTPPEDNANLAYLRMQWGTP